MPDHERDAEYARAELIKARRLLATFRGAYAASLDTNRLPIQQQLHDDVDAFMASTSLYPPAKG